MVVASDDERLFGMLKSRQIAVIPARVDYTLDLAHAIRQNLAIPLQVAGYGNVTVNVRFDGEKELP